ncbi:hypothetical protein ACLOAV_009795 [Pseudogymnoascus australis]
MSDAGQSILVRVEQLTSCPSSVGLFRRITVSYSISSSNFVVASAGHRYGKVRFHDFNFEKDPYDPWASYGQSKTTTIYLANEIERRYGSKGLHALSVHPGIVATNLSQYLSQEIVEGMLKDETRHKTIKSEPQGAAAAVYAGLSREWEGRGGKYLSNLVDEGPADTTRDWLNNEVGYAPWIYDEESASKLWKASNELVGFKSE